MFISLRTLTTTLIDSFLTQLNLTSHRIWIYWKNIGICLDMRIDVLTLPPATVVNSVIDVKTSSAKNI
jgi:hypothetical protein